MNKAIITVLGKDRVGIIAAISAILAECNVNILNISQTIMQDLFTMIMFVDIKSSKFDLGKLSSLLEEKGNDLGLTIKIQHEDIFNSMHRI